MAELTVTDIRDRVSTELLRQNSGGADGRIKWREVDSSMVTVLDVQPAINAVSHSLVISIAALHLYEKSFVCPAQEL